MATGFHGFHVIIGTIFLTVCLIRAYKGALHAAAAFRLRGGGLVLAFRRRGVAVPVHLHLRLGRLGRELRRLMPTVLPVAARWGGGPCEASWRGNSESSAPPPAAAGPPPHELRSQGGSSRDDRAHPPHAPPSRASARAAATGPCSPASPRFAPKCRACGLDFASFNVGDGPAAFLIFIVGGIVVGLAIVTQVKLRRPGGCMSCSGCR